MMCICTKAFVYETDLFSLNEGTIMFSKEDLEKDAVLDKIGNNTLVVKDIELHKLTARVNSCIMILAITMEYTIKGIKDCQ